MLRNKKGEEVAINKIIVIIMVVIVILAVLTFLFKANLLNYIKNLPDYQSPDEDKEIIPSNDTSANSKSCSVEGTIGKVGNFEEITGRNGQFIYIKGLKTNLLWGDSVVEIYEDDLIHFNVGIISNYVIRLDAKLYDSKYRNRHPGLPTIEDLQLLDGSYVIKGNLLCKDKK